VIEKSVSGCVGIILPLSPPRSPNLFKLSSFGASFAWLKFKMPPCHESDFSITFGIDRNPQPSRMKEKQGSMKKWISSLLLLTHSLFAQTPPADTTATVQKPTGSVAAASTKTASSSWQNWVFAGAALAVAAVGVIVVALDEGHNPTSH
jgi:hypothetical protein